MTVVTILDANNLIKKRGSMLVELGDMPDGIFRRGENISYL